MGRNPFEFMPPEEAERVASLILPVMARGEPIQALENVMRRKDGRLIAVETHGVPIRDAVGKLRGYRGLDHDITKRKQAEAQLRLFQEPVARSSDAVGMATSEGRHYYQNAAFERLFGNVGERPPETVYLDQGVGEQVFSAIKAGGEWQGEVQMFRQDRTPRDIFLRAYALRDPEGRITGLVGLHNDITERKQAEAQLRKLQSAVEHSSTVVVITDAKGTIEYVNPQFTVQTGYTAAEAVGQNPRVLKSGQHPSEFFAGLWRALLAGHPWRGELCNRRKDGTLFWESMAIAPILAACRT